MTQSPFTQDEYERFKAWQEALLNDKPIPRAPTTPMPIPREYIWVVSIGSIILILAAWPILIIGLVAGAYIMHKISCKCQGS